VGFYDSSSLALLLTFHHTPPLSNFVNTKERSVYPKRSLFHIILFTKNSKKSKKYLQNILQFLLKSFGSTDNIPFHPSSQQLPFDLKEAYSYDVKQLPELIAVSLLFPDYISPAFSKGRGSQTCFYHPAISRFAEAFLSHFPSLSGTKPLYPLKLPERLP
jgi:hypothetical protein